MTTTGLRDYNIITGRYLEYHEDKLKADQEIQRAEAAYKYWQTHNFDPVMCKNYDADKEQDYLVYDFCQQYYNLSIVSVTWIKKIMVKTK